MIKALDEDPGEPNSIPGPATDFLGDLGLNLFAPLFPICGRRIIFLSLSFSVPVTSIRLRALQGKDYLLQLVQTTPATRGWDQSGTCCCSAPSNSQWQQDAATFHGMASPPSAPEPRTHARNVNQVRGKAMPGFSVTVMAVVPFRMVFVH